MKKLSRSVFSSFTISCIIIVATLLLGYFVATDANNSDLSYRALDYNVRVEDNGDLRIRETVDVKLDSRKDEDDNPKPWKQLYQQYTLRSSNLTNITNISVKNLTSGEEYTQTEPQSPSGISNSTWNEKFARRWYIADVTDGDTNPKPYEPLTDGLASSGSDGVVTKTVEIGWNIPATQSSSSKRFQIDMTWEGVTTAYNDVAKFQWEPFGAKNQTPIGVMTTTVEFPAGVTRSDSWAWLHYSGNSSTERTANGLKFTAYNVRSGQYLDLVAMIGANHMHGVTRHVDEDTKQWTLDDEARQEREWHERQRRNAQLRIVLWVAIAVAGALLAFFGIRSAIRSVDAAKYKGNIEYWREPPNMSPAAAAQLYDIVMGVRNGGVTLANREMASTMMSLVSKGAIAVYPGKAELYRGIDMSRANSAGLAQMLSSNGASEKELMKTSTIVIMPRALAEHHEELNLCGSEERLLGILMEAYKRIHSPVFDLRQMNKAFRKWTNGYKAIEKFNAACKAELESLHATRSVGTAAVTCGILGIIVGIASAFYFIAAEHNFALALCISLPITVLCLFALVYCTTTGITDSGQQYAGQVRGLAKYLEDFSEFSDRGVLDLTLWDRYLVYATAFGISKKALRQLAAAYPQVADQDWLDSNASNLGLLYWSTRPSTIVGSGIGNALANGTGSCGGFAGGFVDIGTQLNSGFSSIQSTIRSAAPSSSSGSGGSFGGGGFGGSGGGSGGGSFGGR